MVVLRKLSDWLGLNKPNKYKFIIAFIIILLNFASLVYVFSYGICVRPTCPKESALSIMLSPLVTFTYTPFFIQSEFADSIVYKRTYANDDNYYYTVERKYSALVEYTIRTIYFLFALSIYLMVSYIVSCVIYKAYEKMKNK